MNGAAGYDAEFRTIRYRAALGDSDIIWRELGHLSRPRRRTHALLPRPKGDPGDPFVPEIGEMYLVETRIFSLGADPAADRRAVVIGVPSHPDSRAPIQVVTRTTQSVPGIPHPADAAIGCEKDGVFADLASVERQLWRPENVIPLGTLPEPFLSRVLERFS